MFVSTNAAAIDFFSLQTANGSSFSSLILRSKKFLESSVSFRTQVIIPAEGTQKISYKLTHGGIVLGSFTPRSPIDFVVNANGNVLHEFTVTVRLCGNQQT